MNDVEHAFWECYIRFVADRFTLRDWKITLDRDRGNPEAWASIWMDQDTNRAVVTLSWPTWKGLSTVDQRHYIIHELAHCHLERICLVTRSHLNRNQDSREVQMVHDGVMHETEMAVDNLARALAVHMPTPDEWFQSFSSDQEIETYVQQQRIQHPSHPRPPESGASSASQDVTTPQWRG